MDKSLLQETQNIRVDYFGPYLALFRIFNKLYFVASESSSDRIGLNFLKKYHREAEGSWIGAYYLNVASELRQLVELTTQRPFTKSRHWNGQITRWNDWNGIIEFWYRIRCLMVHGERVDDEYLVRAFCTLRAYLVCLGEYIDMFSAEYKITHAQLIRELLRIEHEPSSVEMLKTLQIQYLEWYQDPQTVWKSIFLTAQQR